MARTKFVHPFAPVRLPPATLPLSSHMAIESGEIGGVQEGAHLDTAGLEEEGGDMARTVPDETGASINFMVEDAEGVEVVIEVVDETAGVIVENKYDWREILSF